MIASHTGTPLCSSKAITTVEKPAIGADRLRSMPAVMITKVSPERENRDHRALPQQIGDVAFGQEVGRGEGQDHPQHDKQAQQRQREQEAVVAPRRAPPALMRLRLWSSVSP